MINIDRYCFEKYYKLFVSLVETKSDMEFKSFHSNRFLEDEEGYKNKVYSKARKILKYWNWDSSDIGTGKIIKLISSTMDIDNNNLVDWRLKDKFKEKAKNTNLLNDYEKTFYNTYCGKEPGDKCFNDLIDYFGRKYELIAYLMVS